MDTRGLLVRLEAKPGKDDEIVQLFRSALPMVNQEHDTTAWFAVRFGRSEYAIFDTFPTDEARDSHLHGPIARTLVERSAELFASPPKIQKFDVLAEKLPPASPPHAGNPLDAKGLLMTFKAKKGNEHEVEAFLRQAEAAVAEEPKTTAWFALRLDDGAYGIFDAFPDPGGRFAHLTGRVPRVLAKHALSLLGSVPDLAMLNVVAEKLPTASPPAGG